MHINLYYYAKNIKAFQAINRNTLLEENILNHITNHFERQKKSKEYIKILRKMIENYKDGNEYRIVIDDIKNTIKGFKKESEHNFIKVDNLKIIK